MKFIIETYAKNVLASCINGHVKFPKFPRLIEGPDQRRPTLMPAASMGMQKFPKFPKLIEGPDHRIPTKLMA